MFKDASARPSFPEMEEKIIKYWNDNKIFEKSIKQRENNEKFVFFDGPPFANGLPHYGHILANILKDAITRYQTMKGYYVPRTNGWDCHGLPVEYEIEKKLGLSGRKELEEYGVEKFNTECRNSVFTYTKEWEQTLKRVGRWVDFSQSYATLDNNYMESIWWVFKQIWDKGLVYNGYKSMHICPRCETVLSNFEVAQGYKDVTDLSATAKFKLADDACKSLGLDEDVYILAWTTTPWTLPGNTTLALSDKIDYVLVASTDDEGNEASFILADSLKEVVLKDRDFKIIQKIDVKLLEGMHYEPLFDYYLNKDLEGELYSIQIADFVTDEDGTGIVHIAPMFGEDDYQLGREKNCAMIQHVNFDGTFKDEVKDFAGKFVKNQDLNVVKFLAEKGLLFSKQNFKHSYPHCWRCDTPLLNYSTKSLFIEVSKIKDRLLKNNKQIHWQPTHIKEGRFGKWLEGARDWAISRNRFWGAAIPIWQCESCEKELCIGSLKELEEKSGGVLPMRDGELDMHKPYIDEVKLKCDCGGEMSRISDVFDCWFESGSMPYAQLHYPFENKELFEKNFPANFIAEGLDQTRGWFYTLHVIATILFDKPAFNNVIVNGIILAEDGAKLSKRLRNYPEPDALFASKGVDSTRMYLFNSPSSLGGDVRFSEALVDEMLKKFTLTLWNVYSFFVTYANIDKFEPSQDFSSFSPSNKLDKWVLSELNSLVKEVSLELDDYNLMKASRAFMDFLENLSNWYIRRSRRRFWKSENDGDKSEAYQTLYIVLVTFSKLLAPFMPYISDEIYQNLCSSTESVHLADWPEVDDAKINKNLNDEIALIRLIVNLGHSIRAKKKLKVRQPLAKVGIALPVDVDESLILNESQLIMEELNVKDLEIIKEASDIVEKTVSLNPKVLGPKYGADVQHIIKAVKAGEYEVMDDSKLKVLDFVLEGEEFELGFAGVEGFDVEGQNGVVVLLDTEVTDDLKLEGIARDLLRLIQEFRKEMDYNVDDKISLKIESDLDLSEVLEKFADYIKEESLCSEILDSDIDWDAKKEMKLQANLVKISIKRV